MSQSSFTLNVKHKFDQRTAYDKNNVHHPRVAAKILAQTNLQRGWRVLDIACGTGLVTFPAAEALGPEGSIIGLDISSGMLKQAEDKRDKQRHQNITFQEADIERVDFPDESLDAILCASALPYVQDIEHALQKFKRWLRPKGGVLSYNCPEASYTPLIPLLSELLIKRKIKGWRMPMWNMADAAAHQRLLQDAGFASIQVERVVDSALGMQWPQEEYAERGWKMMMGFNMWFQINTLLTDEEKEDLRREFIARADEIGKDAADETGVIDDARSFVFVVANT